MNGPFWPLTFHSQSGFADSPKVARDVLGTERPSNGQDRAELLDNQLQQQ
jgi:hypothetical protein